MMLNSWWRTSHDHAGGDLPLADGCLRARRQRPDLRRQGGRLYVRRTHHGSRWFDVLWNARHVGIGENVEEAKTLAEQLYKEGLL